MSLAAYILRGQPIHNGHVHMIKSALADPDITGLVVLFGSANRPRSHKNPYTYEEREEMLQDILKNIPRNGKKVYIMPLNDYSEELLWQYDVFDKTQECKYLVGYDKDDSSYYLKTFEYLELKEYEPYVYSDGAVMSASDIRHELFTLQGLDPETFAESWHCIMDANIPTEIHGHLLWQQLDKRLISLSSAYQRKLENDELFASYPYKNCLNIACADAVVYHRGDVLLVTRKDNGLLANAGGHKEITETYLQCALRELHEETNINLSDEELLGCLIGEKLFDNPSRSIDMCRHSQVYFFDLSDLDEKPLVKAADDAAGIQWVAVDWVLQNPTSLHEDHHDMIAYLERHLVQPTNY